MYKNKKIDGFKFLSILTPKNPVAPANFVHTTVPMFAP